MGDAAGIRTQNPVVGALDGIEQLTGSMLPPPLLLLPVTGPTPVAADLLPDQRQDHSMPNLHQ